MINESFKMVFNPAVFSHLGGFVIKVDDEIELPVCVVPVALGGDMNIRRKQAEEKAERIVKVLNHCKGIEL